MRAWLSKLDGALERATAKPFFSSTFSQAKLTLFRFVFFGVLCLDMWLQIPHSPRYGAGNFNVSQLPALVWLIPELGRPSVLVLYLFMTYLAGVCAVTRPDRIVTVALATLFGVVYWSSQLDSYQHHYLLWLLLIALACFDWTQPQDERRPQSYWPLRLLLVQVSIVYAWAVITKVGDGPWITGKTVSIQVKEDWARDLILGPLSRGTSDPFAGWGRFAKLVVATEAFLAVAIHVRRLMPVAFVTGIVFHLCIELAGFKIGMFSYFMVAIYTLCIPESWLAWLVRAVQKIPNPFAKAPHWAMSFVPLAAGSALVALVLPFAETWLFVVVITVLTAAFIVANRHAKSVWPAMAHLAVCLAIVTFAHSTDGIRDYYRFWGGTARRLGPTEDALEAYTKLVETSPDYAPGQLRLGQLLQEKDPDAALSAFRAAQRLDPTEVRAFVGEAKIHDKKGRGPEAVRAARAALNVAAGDATATAIVRRWSENGDSN